MFQSISYTTEDFITRKTDAEIWNINSAIAARKTDINVLKDRLKREHPPPRIQFYMQRDIENLKESIVSLQKKRAQLRKQKGKPQKGQLNSKKSKKSSRPEYRIVPK